MIRVSRVILKQQRNCLMLFKKTLVSKMDEKIDPELIKMCKSLIPKLNFETYKGQHGRVGIIGGSKEYTGAPYFAGISALKTGADLVHVICTQASSTVIKSYSPDLIVHPLLDEENGLQEIKGWIDRLHSVVLGPGLGREEKILRTVEDIIYYIRQKDLPLIIDADGLWLIVQNPSIIKGYTKAILSPNAVEFERLYKRCVGPMIHTDSKDISNQRDEIFKLCQALDHVTIIRKGVSDIISDGKCDAVLHLQSSPRRCGGQGDLLSGSLGTFAHWAYNFKNTDHRFLTYGPSIRASYAACLLTRLCAKEAFALNGRSTTTTDLVAQVHTVFSKHFDDF